MVLIKTIGQQLQTKIQYSETSRPQKGEISRLIQNALEISRSEHKFARTWVFPVPFITPKNGIFSNA